MQNEQFDRKIIDLEIFVKKYPKVDLHFSENVIASYLLDDVEKQEKQLKKTKNRQDLIK